MTDRGPVAVDAQWAVHGKRLDRRGYRLLACSTGDLSARHFEEAISRHSPGTPGILPQVTVSFALASSGQDPQQATNYLALAVHEYADEMEGGDDQLKYDDDGRRIVVTRYFCVPYLPLAEKAVAYQAMFQALGPKALPMEDGPPIRVEMTAEAPARPVIDDLAAQAAALLLTTRPVCVLGADDTTMAERLAFMDTVMSLLPYGLRPRMVAATWTRPTNRDHKFRLFFSDAARTAERPDHILYWERPNESIINSRDDWAFEYLTWLRDKIREPTAELARLAEPSGFGREQVLRMLDEIGVYKQGNPSQNYSNVGQDLLHPQHMAMTGPPLGRTYGEILLRNCARHVAEGNQSLIRSDIARLRNMASKPANYDPANLGNKAFYQRVLRETGVLKYRESLGEVAGKLYEPLLRLAFKVPFDYEAFCQVEDCLADPEGRPPHADLLMAIDQVGASDQRVKALLYWNLRVINDTQLNLWYLSGEVGLADLIGMVSARPDRPRHARVFCDVLLDCLAKVQPRVPNPQEIRRILHSHGHLADALQANQVGHEQYQVSALYQLLSYGYPSGIDRNGIISVLINTNEAPTAPLLAAVLLHADAKDAELAVMAYTYGLMTRTVSGDVATFRRITDRLPGFTMPPATKAGS